MALTWILGLLAVIGAAMAHALKMCRVWWAPRFCVGIQVVWIAYAVSSWQTVPLLLLTPWYLYWSIWAWSKWKKER